MRKICKILKKKDVGSIGIGAMIVFIAMVLVAGIAASVLVQTANRLEIQAMTTGDETTSEVATGLRIFDIEAHATGVGTRTVNWLTISIKARAGSEEIDLEQTVIEISDGTAKVLLSYDSTNFNTSVNDHNGQIFSTQTMPWDMDNEQYGLLVLEDADSSISSGTPVLNRGDAVMLCINTANCFTAGNAGLDVRDDVWGQVIPEEGAPGVFSFRVPSSLSDAVHDFY
jgi:flagellin FlaB